MVGKLTAPTEGFVDFSEYSKQMSTIKEATAVSFGLYAIYVSPFIQTFDAVLPLHGYRNKIT
jgi:hypothetical protein